MLLDALMGAWDRLWKHSETSPHTTGKHGRRGLWWSSNYGCATYWLHYVRSAAEFFWASRRFWVKCLCYLICCGAQLPVHPRHSASNGWSWGFANPISSLPAGFSLGHLKEGKGKGKDLPSSLFSAVLNYSNPRWWWLAPVFSSYWHWQNKAHGPSGVPASDRKSKSQLLSGHHLGFCILILSPSSFPQPCGR